MTTMTCRPAVALVLALTPVAAGAQSVEVGVSATVSYAHLYRECCPALTWATFGSGRWRLHVDYQRHFREVEGGTSYPIDDVDGREATVEQALLRFVSRHEAAMLLSWRALARPSYSLNILFGGVYLQYKTSASCDATEGPVVRIPTPANYPPDYPVFRQELTQQERNRCSDAWISTQNSIAWQAGAELDVPLGQRFFFRVGARTVGVGIAFTSWRRAEAGIGVKF